MRFHTYRDESRACHLDLVGGTTMPWSIDLVRLGAAAVLLASFVCALAAQVV